MTDQHDDRVLVFTRLLNAPRELVFTVWTDPKHIVKWWGPTGFTTTSHEMNAQKDGVWRFTMHGPDGVDYKNKIIFLEVVEPERLVYRHSGEEGTEPIHFLVTILFEEKGDQTFLHMRMEFDSREELEYVAREYGAIEGAHQHLQRLDEFVTNLAISTDQINFPFVITRVFSAPRELVFKTFSEAEHLAHWWGPKGMSIQVYKLDFQPGGLFHYKMVAPTGYTMWGKFTYREILAPEKIIFTNVFSDPEGNTIRPPFEDPWPHEILYKVILQEENGKTLLTLRGGPIHASHEEYQTYMDGFASMNEGFGGTFDQLRDYLVTLQP